MAAYQNKDRNYPEQPRVAVPVLTLTPEQVSALSASTKREGFLPFEADEIEMIRDLCPSAHYSDFRRFIYRASGLQLNPLHNDIHMEYKYVKEQPKATFVIHIDGFRKIAASTGQFDGFKQVPGEDSMGRFVDTTIWRKDSHHPFESRVYFAEFLSTQGLYGSKPYHMVSKCGAALGYKIAFPVSGLSSEDEVEAWIDPPQNGQREQSGTAQGSAYAVGEIGATPAEATKPTPAPAKEQAAPAAATTAEPKPQTEAEKAKAAEDAELVRLKEAWLAAKNRLVAHGLTKGDLETYHSRYYEAKKITGKPTPQQGVTALEDAEAWIAKEGIAKFLAAVREPVTPAADGGDAWAEDPAVRAALDGVRKRFGLAWSPELTRIAALWCADQLREADQLDAFLINSGLNAQAQPGKLESFLAITRHMAISAAPGVAKYVTRNESTFSELESALSAAVGSDIRYAMDLPRNAVYAAFAAINAKGKVD